jgi:acyl-CoA reductase-like NAD-dependent aldehyde dehydrogenase
MVPLQMELGGKDVCIVCPDADLDLAATSIVKGGLSYQGQRCALSGRSLQEQCVCSVRTCVTMCCAVRRAHKFE